MEYDDIFPSPDGEYWPSKVRIPSKKWEKEVYDPTFQGKRKGKWFPQNGESLRRHVFYRPEFDYLRQVKNGNKTLSWFNYRYLRGIKDIYR